MAWPISFAWDGKPASKLLQLPSTAAVAVERKSPIFLVTEAFWTDKMEAKADLLSPK